MTRVIKSLEALSGLSPKSSHVLLSHTRVFTGVLVRGTALHSHFNMVMEASGYPWGTRGELDRNGFRGVVPPFPLSPLSG